MLKLREIEMLGFKSFADKTRLACDGTTTAVVGPNGCGKSNLADAVSWVLGEQSARMLRGERMSDVIFNGTGTRPPTGLAEVSMTLVETRDEETGEQEIGEQEIGEQEIGGTEQEKERAVRESGARNSRVTQFGSGEIKVTRRLFRSGESEYLLNGTVCRLRDIQDIFMGTGLGPESYAIIEQGRIGQILSSKPSDRRSIIEEAAGVSKFKSRKRLAEAKLESARQNLARINDILEEISKQVNSLKRQASKAARYRSLQQELNSHQKRVYTSRWMKLDSEFQKVEQELATIQGECSSAARELENIEAERNGASSRHEQLEEELRHLRESIAQSEIEGERLRSRLEKSRQQANDLEARAAETAREQEQTRLDAGALEQRALDQARRAQQLNEECALAQGTVRRLATLLEEKTRQLASLDSEVEAQRQGVLEAVSRAAEFRNQAIQTEEMGLAAERQGTRLKSERDALETEHRELAAELERLAAGHSQCETELNSVEQLAAEAAAGLGRAREDEASRREYAESLSRELSAASARRQALEESLARHAYATDSARRLLSMSSPDRQFQPLGILADYVEVTGGYEDIVEEFLKSQLDCVVVERHDEARHGIAMLEGDGGGRSAFFVRQVSSNGHGHQFQPAQAPDAGGNCGVVASLQEIVKLQPRLGINGDLAFPILAQSFIVEDAGAAERMAAAYPSCHFLTPQGEHYHHRLVSGGKASNAGPLALRRDFRELERRVAELQSAWSEAQERAIEARALMERLESALKEITERQLATEKAAVVSSERLRQAREAVRRAADRVSVLDRELDVLNQEREKIEERRQTVQSELDRARSDQAQRDRSMAEASSRLHALRSESEPLSRSLTEAQINAGALEERWRAADAEGIRMAAELAQTQEKLARLTSQTGVWSGEACRLRTEAEKTEALLADAERRFQSLQDQLCILESESRLARCRRDELIPQVEEARARLDGVRDKRSQNEVALARAESDLRHLIQQCGDEVGAEPAALRAEFAPEELFEGDRLETAEQELRELKDRLDRLGPVNMMALEELQEAEGRLVFLETQRQDLLASIADTTQTIREIDEASCRKFMEAFKAINGFFGESFRTLFGGGMGEMRFSDEADAESGIELVVQPPGKRLQNVLLLSGGEKALTALALLIAVFRFTPSPFCILDEVDAPLDDSNVVRFARMIQAMSNQTQFILMTHNKRTMEACGVMYGVTMEEPGVSKLVSVRFNSTLPDRMAASA